MRNKENPLQAPSEIVDRHLREKSTLPIIIPSILGRRVSRRSVIIKTGEVGTGLLLAATGLIGEEVSQEQIGEQANSPAQNITDVNKLSILEFAKKQKELNTKPPSNNSKIGLVVAGVFFIIDGVLRTTPITHFLPRKRGSTSPVR